MNTITRTHVARFRVLIALAAVVVCAPVARAQSPTWSNTGTNFNLGANWSSGAVPSFDANFNNAAVFQPNLASTVSIRLLQFNAAASGYSLTSSPGAQFNLSNDPGTARFLTSSATSGFNTVSAAINLTGVASGTQRVIVSAAAPLVWNGPITANNSGVFIAKQRTGTLFMGSNSYDGPFGWDGRDFVTSAQVAGGTIVIDSIGNVGGGASSLGAPTTAANGTIRIANGSGLLEARLRYVGGMASTNRDIRFDAMVNNLSGFMLQASGAGPLTWAGNLVGSGETGSSRWLWLGGISEAANTFSGVISDGSLGTVNLLKNGAGNWTLTGANTYSGTTVINGGTLTVDYQQGGALSSGPVTFNPQANPGFTYQNGGGTLRLVAKSSGATTQTVGNMSFLTGNGAAGAQQRIVLEPNGGSGITLNTGTWGLQSDTIIVLDLPTGATLNASSVPLVNSLISVNASHTGIAVVRDSTGIGFATLSGSSVVRYTGATALTATTANASGNFSTSGNLTMTAGSRSVQSLDVNTTGGGTLNMSNQNFVANTLLFTGSGNYTMSSGTITGLSFIHQHSTGLVTLDTISQNAGSGTRKGGAGTLALTGRSTANLLGIYDGAVRANGATVYSAGNIVLGTGGVLELGAAGNFTGAIGSAAGQIRWAGDGGFSAFGAERTVQIGGNTNTLTWGATNFVPDDNALVLSNVASDSTIDFQNGLNLGTQQRLVRVANGSAAIDGRLSGVLSGNYGGGLYKTGAGTLELTAANTYIGQTTINAGTLRVSGGGSINQSQRVLVNSAASELNYNSSTALTAPLQVTAGTISGTGTISSSGGVSIGTGAIISPGNSPGIQAYTTLHAWAPGGTYKWELNALTGSPGTNWDLVNVTSGTFSLAALADTPGNRFVLDLTTLGAGDVAGQLVNPYDGGSYTFAIANYNPANFLLPTGFFNTAGTDLTGLFQINLGNWQGTQPQAGNISVKINSGANGIDLVIVPEPGALALAGIGIAAAGYAYRRRRS